MTTTRTQRKRTPPAFPHRVPDSLRHIFTPREPLTLVDWTERHIRLTEGPAVGEGVTLPWSRHAFPLQRAVMESVEEKRYSRTVLMTGPQTFGKTQSVGMPPLLHALHYRRTSAVYVAASRELAVTQWTRKISPAIDANPELAALKPDNPDHAGTKYRRDFTNGQSIFFVGSESIGNLSGYTAPVIVCDDVQAYPETVPKFGSPADYAVSRSESFPSDMVTLVFAGTAGTVDDWLWRSLNASALFCPFVPCLECGTYQLVELERMTLRDERNEAGQPVATLSCCGPDCDHNITFEELPQMLERHLWASCPPGDNWVLDPPPGGATIDPDEAAIYPETRRNTSVAGFWCNAFTWPFGKTWGERLIEHAEAAPDAVKLKTYTQNVLVRPYKPPEIDEDALTVDEVNQWFKDADTYAARTVPAAADLVTITIDVQQTYIYYLVRAWRASDGTSWLIDLKTTEKLNLPGTYDRESYAEQALHAALTTADEMARQGWPVADGSERGRIVKPSIGLIDFGNFKDTIGTWHRRFHRGFWRLVWGRGDGVLWSPDPKEYRHRYKYREIGVNAAKDILRRRMRIPAGESGHWHLPATGIHSNTLRAYARHLVAERREPDGKWKNPTGAANHYWDCEVYQIAAAFACRVNLPGDISHAPPQPRPRKRKTNPLTTPAGQPFFVKDR